MQTLNRSQTHSCAGFYRKSSCSLPRAPDGTVELEIKVGGMMCDGCTSRVSEALRNACPGKVVNVEVSLPELARVEVRASSQLDAVQMLPTFLQTVEALGFTAEPQIEGL
ncbi:HMA domain-containing protein [Haematococcus lacustris]|uniref:HMA domain-containing protein n=1 Tax=Haematococcus lacustris TaxID=44745 RepID=A0A699YX32_HAELA|nr:HMA domain-containing protein [Haematococcus lacustris]